MAERDMLELIRTLPEQLARAAELGRAPHPLRKRSFDSLVIAGMGGSGFGGELVRTVLAQESVLPVTVLRDYRLPFGVGGRTLLFVSSYSGNTEEALAVYQAGQRLNADIICLTSGGILTERARRDGVPVLLVPAGLPPRAAVGYMSVPILVLLSRMGIVRSFQPDITETRHLIEQRFAVWQRRARRLARALLNRFPVVYSTARLLDTAAYRWRCQLNENAKVFCHHGELPEASHNEIMGFGAPDFLNRRIFLIGLVDRTTHPRTILRLRALVKLTGEFCAGFKLVKTEGASALARLFSAVVLGDLVSVALARERGVDPMGIPRIDHLKALLGKRKGRDG